MHQDQKPTNPSVTALEQVILFSGLKREDLEHLAAFLRRRRYSKGEVVFLRGDAGTSLYLVEHGRVKISLSSAEGREIVLALLGPGDFFGDLTLLDGKPRSADVIAMEPCQLLLLEREDFLQSIRTNPAVATRLLEVLSHRLRQDNDLVQEAAFLDVPARLARALIRLVESQGNLSAEYSAKLTQAELAGMIGATRESVSKWLGVYERQGLISNSRGRVTVLQPKALRDRVR